VASSRQRPPPAGGWRSSYFWAAAKAIIAWRFDSRRAATSWACCRSRPTSPRSLSQFAPLAFRQPLGAASSDWPLVLGRDARRLLHLLPQCLVLRLVVHPQPAAAPGTAPLRPRRPSCCRGQEHSAGIHSVSRADCRHFIQLSSLTGQAPSAHAASLLFLALTGALLYVLLLRELNNMDGTTASQVSCHKASATPCSACWEMRTRRCTPQFRAKILSCGRRRLSGFGPHTVSNDAALRRHAQQIVLHFDRQAADDHFLAFCLRHGEEFDLEQSTWLFRPNALPPHQLEAYQALLDGYANELRGRLVSTSEPRQSSDDNEPLPVRRNRLCRQRGQLLRSDNSYLNRVIDNRTGNPINLSLLYILVARRLRLPITGIGLPATLYLPLSVHR